MRSSVESQVQASRDSHASREMWHVSSALSQIPNESCRDIISLIGMGMKGRSRTDTVERRNYGRCHSVIDRIASRTLLSARVGEHASGITVREMMLPLDMGPSQQAQNVAGSENYGLHNEE